MTRLPGLAARRCFHEIAETDRDEDAEQSNILERNSSRRIQMKFLGASSLMSLDVDAVTCLDAAS